MDDSELVASERQGLGFAEDFGQKVDLTQRIREVLANYPEGTTILKELIQNADDAGATEVSFCIDRRRHAAQSLYNAPLAEWQGPALLAFNNSQFSEEDFESISRIGDSKKRGQSWKTGRFGVGFNSVYHLSDLPSFVSGRYVVLFDPHCKFLPRVNSANPGKRIDFVATGAKRLHPDQFSPYCAFGCDMEKPYHGTLFRFPLRTPQQAAVSRLSRQAYAAEDMAALLHELYQEAVSAMLFLKNVESIKIYDWKLGAESPEELYSCGVKAMTAEVRWHRQAFSRLSRQAPSAISTSAPSSNINDIFRIEFVSKGFAEVGKEEEERTEVFLISQCMGAPMSRISVMARNAEKDYDIHLVPWASVAAKFSENQDKDLARSQTEGRAFCFLPLPVKTGLPVHVNGYFELSSNRRDIWYGGDMDRGGKLRSDWNRCLLEDVVAAAYADLMREAARLIGPTAMYESLWPCGSFVDPWLLMVRRFYSNAAELAVLHSAAQGGKWITPSQSLFHDEDFVDADGLASAVLAEGLPLVRYSSSLLRMLFNFCLPSPKMLTPSTMREQLNKPGKHGGLVDRKNALILLEYCLGDVIDDEAGERLAGLPLLPLANGRLGVFGKKASRGLVFVCNKLEYSLLARIPEKSVDMNIPKRLLDRLDNIAHVQTTNLRHLNDVQLLQLLCYLLPVEWKGKEAVQWKPEGGENYPNQEWLVLLWRYLKQCCKDLSAFKEWPLLPTTDGYLCKLMSMSKVVKGGVCGTSLENLLCKLGCRILRTDLVLEHSQLSMYVHDASGPGILDAITSAVDNQLHRLLTLFECVTDVERRALREYLYQQKWFGGDQMNEARLRVFRALPIFEAYDEMNPAVKLFVDLGGPKRFLAPTDMDEALLGTEFLFTVSEREVEVLTGPLGVRRLGRAAFYKWRVVGRVSKLAPELRNTMMLAVLRELPQLCASDPTMKEMLKQLPFVPTASGELRAPKALYDPRSSELRTLLNDKEFFPAEEFASPDILDMLQGLGLKTSVLPETVLQSARQVEALFNTEPEIACAQGQALLSYLELNSNKWLAQTDDSNRAIGRMFTKVSTIFQPKDFPGDPSLNKFWNELITICWCPVMIDPPHSHLPWPTVSSPVAPPKLVRLQSDLWLASASMRILDGECRSAALSMRLGWASRLNGSVLAAQLLELGKNHVVVEDRGLGQALATAVPRVYTILNEMLGTDEMEIVKAVLEGSRWVWVGDGFANVREVAFSGPLHLAPYLRVIPADLAVFKELLLELGVRESLTPTEFGLVLANMAKDMQGSPLDPRQLSAAIWLVQHLADLHFSTKGAEIFVPDALSVLVPASDLVYNDAPWLPHSDSMHSSSAGPTGGLTTNITSPKFVHSKISNDVAERLGVRSLRRLMLAESSDSMDLGLHDAAEAFGQHEALTTRLKHIVEMYSDGPGILCELVQNADDAGASEVCFLLDKSQYGKSSVLSPRMGEWQGPALYCFNNSVFTPQDLYAISRIGQDSKIERPSAIGRFGLGFNAVYHFTDVPGFVSGGNIVMFDPHACNLPGITPSHPGLKINFVGRGLLEQFPDQFHPYLHFGCDLQKSFAGTLFRFPLRNATTAASSEIKQEAYKSEDVLSLFQSFQSSAAEALLFLRNVASVSVYVREDANQEMRLLYRIQRLPPESPENFTRLSNTIYDFVRGDPSNPIDKEQFYRKLSKIPESQLPWHCTTVQIRTSSQDLENTESWFVSNVLGGGSAREQAVAVENRARGFVPWAGIAAPVRTDLQENSQMDSLIRNDENGGKLKTALEGRAFCFLPLPVKIGLPVHVNGYFELSSNRRDIWYGDDMAGGGKLRSKWNCCLLEDVAAPAYARLLARAALELGPTAAFSALWPTASVGEPWSSMVRQVYIAVTDLDLAVLYVAAGRGKWISPRRSVFPDLSFPEAEELGKALAEAGFALISATADVVASFREFCPSLRFLTPQLLRKSLVARKGVSGPRRVAVMALKYCLSDVLDSEVGEKLQGLSLLPLATGAFGMVTKVRLGERLLVTNEVEYNLLQESVPYMLIDREIDRDVLSRLQKVAEIGGTNLQRLTCALLLDLLPRLVPSDWRGKSAVLWTPEVDGHPSVSWMELLWTYLAVSCENLLLLSDWPLLPTSDGQLLRISKNSRVLCDDGLSENMICVLKKAHCFILRPDLALRHPSLGDFVHEATAVGVLNALLAASGNRMHDLPHLLSAASDGELRELRSFMCQSKWFSGGHMDATHLQILRALPIFECFGSTKTGSRKFVNLPESKRWLPPDGLEDGILGESFIRVESAREELVLTKYLGVKKLNKVQFYQEHMFLNILQIPLEIRARAMLAVLDDLPRLTKDDPRFLTSLSQLPFVSTRSGAMEAPDRLYDPRILELQTLLNKQAFFPSVEFASDSTLDILVTLGLRRSLGRKGLLDSARSVAMISGSDQQEARSRATALLTHLDDLELASTSGQRSDSARAPGDARSTDGRQCDLDILGSVSAGLETTETLGKSLSKPSPPSASGKVPRHVDEHPLNDADDTETQFWQQLVNISWCPVHAEPPDPGLPWPSEKYAVIAPPKITRPKAQMWFVSASMHILDGDCQSPTLAEKLGWTERPNVGVLAVQLIEFSKSHAIRSGRSLLSGAGDGGGEIMELNRELSKEIPTIYKYLQELVNSEDLMVLQTMLEGIRWVWVGDSFVSPNELAFDSPAHFHPYLHIVPSEIVEFRHLLTKLGVRETFEANDYARVLIRISEDLKGQSLSSEQLTFTFRVLEALAEVLPVQGLVSGESSVGTILVPDALGILLPAKDLVYNDAPWLAKSVSGLAGMRRLVHPEIENELAERLGAKSLRYLSLVDQEMTSNLPCLEAGVISDVISVLGDEDLLLFDLLEIADSCKVRRVHVIYDKREHPRQSLLQPNLGQFQGPAMTVVLEGAVLSTEEVCILQNSPPPKLRGHVCQYGSGLLSAYHVTELPFIVSGGCLYLFDPSGLVLAPSLAKGRAGPSGSPVGKAYSLKGTDLPQRFMDQFRPLRTSQATWSWLDSTIIRMPLRTAKQASESKMKNVVEYGDREVARMLNKFKSHASTALLFLSSVENVSVTAWEDGESVPHNLFSVQVDPGRSSLRHPFQEKKWRKFQLSSLFGGFNVPSKIHNIDVLLTEDGKQTIDKWLVVQSLGSGHTRDMALDRKYLSYNLTPIAGVAAHLSRNGLVPTLPSKSYMLSPLPLPTPFKLPVTILGHFMVSQGGSRHLFHQPPGSDQLLPVGVGTQIGANYSPEQLRSAWNKELLACVRDSYIELLQELHRVSHDPTTSRADPPIGWGLDGAHGFQPERVYALWPKAAALLSTVSEVEDSAISPSSAEFRLIDRHCLVNWLVRPMYARLVDLPVWKLHGGAMTKASEGMFLAPPGAEQQGVAPPVAVCDFLKAHYKVFAVPWELSKEIESCGVAVKELTPKMLRSLLRTPQVAAAVQSIATQVDLLDYCCADVHVQELPNTANIAGSSHMTLMDHESAMNRSSNSSSGGSTPSVMASGGNWGRSRQRPEQAGDRQHPGGLDAGGDAFGLVADIGRVIADIGRGVLEDFSRDAGSSSSGTSSRRVLEDNYSVDRVLLDELKGLQCPTARNNMAKLGVVELWVGSKEQQLLLPIMSGKFVHSLCLERPHLAELLNNSSFQMALKLQAFSPQLLATNLGLVLPRQWIGRGNDAISSAPWVSWDFASDTPSQVPSPDWLRLLWRNLKPAPDELALFAQWPLIPCVLGAPFLVRVQFRQLVFVPPKQRMSGVIQTLNTVHETQGLEDASLLSDEVTESGAQAFDHVESQYPWLLPLLISFNVPVYDKRFLDTNALQSCIDSRERSLGQIVVSKLLAVRQANCFPLPDLTLAPTDCEALFSLFSSCTFDPPVGPSVSSVPVFTEEELSLLKSLPIYKTVKGSYVPIDSEVHCVVPPSAFMQPDDEHCLLYLSIPEGGSLYHALHIPELHDHEVMANFALPGFERSSKQEQEAILEFLFANWSSLKQEDAVVTALKDTKFVQSAQEYQLDKECVNRLYSPSELLDPDNVLLKNVFAAELEKFPGGQFATSSWLRILRDAGLRSGTDAGLLLECARKVEELGRQGSQTIADADGFETDGTSSTSGVSLQLWSVAGMLVDTILGNFASLYGSSFCNSISQLAFVPAERGIPGTGGKRVLAAYNEAVLQKDWTLAWTCAPILVRPGVVPPEFSWMLLQLRSPPPFSVVLKHLQVIGKNGGEDILARWPNVRGIRSVEDAFTDVLKFLTSSWDGLSTSDKNALMGVRFIPVANGTRLAPANALYARLSMDLAPFVFELPRAYLPYVKVLSSLGMEDAPTFESMKSLLAQLQRSCGYQRLNPNELRAVLHILQFICDNCSKVNSTSRLNDATGDAVVPDDGARLLHGRTCVYVDALGASLVGHIDSSRVRFVHPLVSEELCIRFGVRKLSDVVIEELDENKSLEVVDAIGPFHLSSISQKLRSYSFATAIWEVIQDTVGTVTPLRRLTREQTEKSLQLAADGLWFVRRLYTRFLMVPMRTDVTRTASRKTQPILSNTVIEDDGHRVYEFWDKSKDRVLIAEPPNYVDLPDLLALVISRILGSPICLPIHALFKSPLGSEPAVKGVLRLGSHSSEAFSGEKGSRQQSATPGIEVVAADAALVQCHPLRPFHAGEIVAWRSLGEGGSQLRYGRVVEDVKPSAGQALYRLQVETKPKEIQLILSSNVLSFKGTAAVKDSAELSAPVDSNRIVRPSNLEGVKAASGSTADVEGHVEQVSNRSEAPLGNVPAAEVVRAVKDMLSAVGMPVGFEQLSLLERSMTLQEQLNAAETAFSIEQERADVAMKDAEAAKAAWTCRVCLTAEVDTTVVPCGHVLCQRCSSAVSRCPFCRHSVSKALRLFRP